MRVQSKSPLKGTKLTVEDAGDDSPQRGVKMPAVYSPYSRYSREGNS